MSINFDEIIDRKGTNSLKYDFAAERGRPTDLLPLWVADMDFRIAQPILDDLHAAIDHGIFGYSEVKGDYFAPLHDWFLRRFGYASKPEWLLKTPGIVYAIACAIHAYTREGDAVLLQQPVYYPFMECIVDSRRKLVNSQLHYENGKYTIDFEDFERQITDHQVKLFLLCSPHNPVGRVWTREELQRIGDICEKHDVLILSDEIHCDFTYDGHPHTVFPSLSPALADRTILCTSPTKTFNFAGLQISNIFISNPALRQKFQHAIDETGYSQLNTMGLVASRSAYEKGEPWLLELKAYLRGNLDFCRTFLQERLPQIRLIEPEGTYRIWLDCAALGLTVQQLDDLVLHDAKLWLDSGAIFGPETEQFQRINIACPRALLQQALEQLANAIDKLPKL